jgi:hypothetical protein
MQKVVDAWENKTGLALNSNGESVGREEYIKQVGIPWDTVLHYIMDDHSSKQRKVAIQCGPNPLFLVVI